ncbi:hypothetical protein CFC21_060178 [Triticum aestivum]|uniref:Uncharacterized protein n=2 Tax=Triticum aestivum TaxID=4565 RepID=A0A9R1KFE5_WHEAT|nr:uncharacterized protein LOC123099378 [Triticum aestivum]KAF7052016.1 hypothetical protein CFC21_060178 [Triticum aestivum]
MGEGAPCSFTPRRRGVLWRGLGLGRRRKLQVAWLGGGRAGGGGGRCHGLLRRLRLRWLRRAVRKLAAIYMAALAGPPASSSCPAWVGVEPCFATPFIFVPNAPRFL